jgi:hypothetical protein
MEKLSSSWIMNNEAPENEESLSSSTGRTHFEGKNLSFIPTSMN